VFVWLDLRQFALLWHVVVRILSKGTIDFIAEWSACRAGAVTNLWVCAKPRQAKARELSAEWGLRRPPREGALVALLPVRLSYRIEWNFPRAVSDAVRHLKQRPAARRPRRSASPLFAAGERARIAKRLIGRAARTDPKGNVTSWNTGADKGL
jgi:hypothetical protein